MINIDNETANKMVNLAWSYAILVAFGAVGFLAGRLSGYNETDLELAKLEGQLEQHDIRIQRLKDAYLDEDLDED